MSLSRNSYFKLLAILLSSFLLALMISPQAFAATAKEKEPNDKGSTATKINIGDSVKATISQGASFDDDGYYSEGDSDVYKIKINQPCNVKVTFYNDKVVKNAAFDLMWSGDKNGNVVNKGDHVYSSTFSAKSKKAQSETLSFLKKGAYVFAISNHYSFEDFTSLSKDHPYHFKLSYANPTATSISKITAQGKAFTAKWKKSIYATQYQLRYSTAKSMKNAKTIKVSNKTTSTKVKKLKAGKKYYVQIRVIQKIGSKKYYSKWSKAKTVTTKSLSAGKAV